MKDRQILKQVAIAVSEIGGIGYGSKLLFSSKADLAEFARFTNRTVLVVGLNTAQQMLDLKVEPTAERPWVVISRGQIAMNVSEPYKHLLYATDLDPALDLAEELIEKDVRLVGWTIAGGTRTYEKLIEKINGADGIGILNSAYILRLNNVTCPPDQVLTLNAQDFVAAVRKTMVSDYTVSKVQAGYQGRDGSGAECRVESEALTLIDGNVFDPRGIRRSGELFGLELSDKSRFTFRLGELAGYSVETTREAMTLWFAHRDLNKEVRLENGRPALNYLETLLQRSL